MAAPLEAGGARRALIALALGFLALFLVLPLAVVLGEALSGGVDGYRAALRDAETVDAIRLTLITAAIAVPLNTLFGIAAAWAIARFRFPGRPALVALIDLPVAVSPVIAGMIFALVFGRHGWLGAWLGRHDLQVIFALPGIVLATMFVTVPFVARELIPVMAEQGSEAEEAALSLGANGWQVFCRVTLPGITWGLLYGVMLSGARAIGEFGAVSVVSGHIRGVTTTLPLQVEILYNEYHFVGAFAAASLLLLMAVVTLAIKAAIEWRSRA
ncbi:MAG: sulfate ABC transporter permease subunit CysW [Gemmatimonadota bacterium]